MKSAGIAALAVALALPAPAPAAPPAGSAEFFETNVRPVLIRHCSSCHAGGKRKGGLSLESRDALLAGGDTGPAIVPGKPGESRLIAAVRYADADLQMPPKGKLPDAEVADLTAWVKAGAPWPKAVAGKAEARAAFDLPKRKQEHWAWQPVRPAPPPAVRDPAWVRDPADAHILAGLEAVGLRPAPATDPATWLRRVTFDLTGLPPTVEDVEAILADSGPTARAAVVDRLLASPAFGERWGRHWLDLVRYAESRGHEFDYPIPNARQYRDYVVRAVNADVPYDRLVREHLAGDLMTPPRTDPATGANESVLGTGFWFLGEELHSPVDIRQDQADRFDNRIDVMSKAFLGLTVACARCHDHKFDAIAQKDYYALYGFLSSGSYRQVRFDDAGRNEKVAAELAAVRARAGAAVGRALAGAAAGRRVADYLLAAREAILDGPGDPPARVAELARERGLDAAVLAAWVRAVRHADRDPTDPLHVWAKACVPGSQTPDQFAAVVRAATGSDRRPAADVRVVFDFGRLAAADWMPDGPAFGPRPRRRGELVLGGTPERPAVDFTDRAAACYDRTWDGLRSAAGTDAEPGALGSVPARAGRTLYTPTFKLTGEPLYYLARGEGTVYAPVGSHVMIAGPLHGGLITKLGPADGKYHWHRHDLSRYRGLDAHLEFTPAVGSDFAVAAVVRADRAPSDPPEPFLPPGPAHTPAALAAGYARAFDEAVRRLGDGTLTAEDAPAGAARIAAWLAHHPDVLADHGRAVTVAAAGFVAEERTVAAGIKAESRLAPAMLDGSGVDEHVFIRGSSKAEGELVPRRFLEALSGEAVHPARGSGRLELAAAVTDPARNPLIARVAVNRVWHHLFGRGIVASVDNFGVLGERPTHPELLDHLADRFVRDGWSLKRLVRGLVLSNTYGMSSHPSADADQADPGNRRLHRARLRRLEAEAVRDAVLAVSGRLDRTAGGPSVPVYLTEFVDGRGRPAGGPLDGAGRRSLYLAVRRNFLPPMLLAFDLPVPFSTVGRRSVSNVPAQSLILMNDPFVHQQAEVWGERVRARPGTAADRVRRMYVEAFARPPSPEESAACLEFLNRRAGPGRDPDAAAWAALAHVLFNAKEFIFLG